MTDESAEVILLPVILIPPAVKFDIPAIVVLLAPKLIDVVPIVIAEFDRFVFTGANTFTLSNGSSLSDSAITLFQF